MSKTQDKRTARIAEAAEFIKERRTLQYRVLKANFDTGVHMYEANKDKISPEEQALLEAEMAKQWELLEKLKKDFGIDGPDESSGSLE